MNFRCIGRWEPHRQVPTLSPPPHEGPGCRRRGCPALSLAALLFVLLSGPATSAQVSSGPAAGAESDDEAAYSARARVKGAPAEAFALREAETDAVESALGPAFATSESMPGVVPVFSGVPYLIVRGATPAGSLNYYDGIPVPSLFHLALGPSITDPGLAGSTRFAAGAASVRYAAHLGGVLDRAGPDARTQARPARHLHLSLLDAGGLLSLPTADGAFSASWRFGTPGLMLRALGIDATLGYYNFQVRYQTALSSRTTLTLVLLGANDHLGNRTVPADDIDLSFQRLLARLTTRLRGVELGSSLLLSNDTSSLGQQLDGSAQRVTESLYLLWRGERAQLRVGADAVSALVKFSSAMPSSSTTTPFVDSSFTRQRELVLDPQDFLNGQPYATAPSRTMLGAYAELRFSPVPALRLTGGVRADAFIARAEVEGAVSPMLRARYEVTDRFDVHGAAALTHKPRTSPLALPGLNDISLDRGVEAAVQSELGIGLKLDDSTVLELNTFFHRYRDVVYLELILDCQGNTDPNATPGVRGPMGMQSICRSEGLPTASGDSYGVELFLKRDLTQRLSGFLSYTHAYANATARDGTAFAPQGDVRHLANAVLLYRLGGGWSLGTRAHFRTGKIAVNTILDISRQQVIRLHYRLPSFFRLDVHLSYAFRVSFGRVTASIGLQNATFSREATNRDCMAPEGTLRCEVDYQPYIVLPNAALRADF